MSTDLTVVHHEFTCEAAPTQAEGLLSDGRFFYFRARHTTVRMEVYRSAADFAAGFATPSVLRVRLDQLTPGEKGSEHQLSFIPEEHAVALMRWMAFEIGRAEAWATRDKGTT